MLLVLRNFTDSNVTFSFSQTLYFGNSPILQCSAKVILICAASVLRGQTGTRSKVHEEAVISCWAVSRIFIFSNMSV